MEQAADTASRANDKAQAAGDAAMAGGGAAAGAASGPGRGRRRLRQRRAAGRRRWPRTSSAASAATARCSACSRWRGSSSGSPGARRSSTSPRACRSPTSCSRSTARWSARPTARTSASTRSTRGGCAPASDFDRARTDLTKSRENVRRQVQSRGGRAVTREDVLAGEVAEDAITMNAQGMLGALSESTGGRLIANSNDVRAGLDRALADTAGYYEITYDPQLAAFDGAFRRVSVKVKRPGVERAGARGLLRAAARARARSTFPGSCRSLKVLKASPAPHDFDTRAAAYHFGPERGEAPPHARGRDPARRALPSRARAARAGRTSRCWRVVRDAEGRGARALQPGLAGRGAREEPRGAEAGQRRLHAQLHPAARALLGSRSWCSTRWRSGPRCARASSSSRPPRPGLALSSVAVVKRTEPVAEGALESSDPLRNGSNRIVPFVGEPTFAGRARPCRSSWWPTRARATRRARRSRASPSSSRATAPSSAARPPSCRRPTPPATSPTWRASRRRASRRAATRWPPSCARATRRPASGPSSRRREAAASA